VPPVQQASAVHEGRIANPAQAPRIAASQPASALRKRAKSKRLVSFLQEAKTRQALKPDADQIRRSLGDTQSLLAMPFSADHQHAGSYKADRGRHVRRPNA